ncbi:MAG: hypothetical protein Ct9H300mP1_16830 [Planctomycetaceae bacterium]|nr:MAG: hypothetical protein Ct9H300mP1_16830 [Planctomycetaceae bacterium]
MKIAAAQKAAAAKIAAAKAPAAARRAAQKAAAAKEAALEAARLTATTTTRKDDGKVLKVVTKPLAGLVGAVGKTLGSARLNVTGCQGGPGRLDRRAVMRAGAGLLGIPSFRDDLLLQLRRHPAVAVQFHREGGLALREAAEIGGVTEGFRERHLGTNRHDLAGHVR